jgi:hypothetical protein
LNGSSWNLPSSRTSEYVGAEVSLSFTAETLVTTNSIEVHPHFRIFEQNWTFDANEDEVLSPLRRRKERRKLMQRPFHRQRNLAFSIKFVSLRSVRRTRFCSTTSTGPVE